MGVVRQVDWKEPDGVEFVPDSSCGVGVLVLAGSSGRVDSGRAQLFAQHGARACSIQWFGGEGQAAGVCEIPLETFTSALDRLATHSDLLAVIGLSIGAEAGLLTGVHDQRIGCVVAFAPTAREWANSGSGLDGRSSPPRSRWTWRGTPVPFTPYADDWAPDSEPPSYRGLYDRSARLHPERAVAAAIPVESILGDVILIAGGNDRVWDSVRAAEEIDQRRSAHGLLTTVITHPTAGHRTILPGETQPPTRSDIAYGGDPKSDADLGALAWPAIVSALGLRP